MRTLLFAYLKAATALTFDLFTAFVGAGYLVGYLTGAITPDGIQLSNIGVAATFLLMATYFAVGAWRGATPWQRIVGTREPSAAAT